MIKHVLKMLLITIILAFLILLLLIFVYEYNQKKNYAFMEFCKLAKVNEDYSYNKNTYFQKIYKIFEPHLLMNKVYLNGKELKMVRFDSDITQSYTVPEIALEKADALIGYGIGPNISFENDFSKRYQKPSYAFDCSNRKELVDKKIETPLCTFYEECIKTDRYIVQHPHYGSNTKQHKIHSFDEKIEQLNLADKKIYVKLSIGGAEYLAMPEILKYSDNITGLSIKLHLSDIHTLYSAIELLEDLEKNFILVHRSYLYLNGAGITVSYINKNLVDKYYIPLNQSNNIKYEYYGRNKIQDEKEQKLVPISRISPIVALVVRIKKLFNIEYQSSK